MSERFQKTKPSFLEAGLPCASLSAESQRDNNARQRPPQNRLHIWWARRTPTVCRAAILAGLLPYDMQLDESVFPPMVDEPSVEDLEDLPPKLQEHRGFFERLLAEVEPTQLPQSHNQFLRALEILGDANRAWRRLALAEGANDGKDIILGSIWGYRHERAFVLSPSSNLLTALYRSAHELLQFTSDDPVVVLDSMAGGGVIPLEATRYGLKVYANDLNPVAALVLKATVAYPAQFGRALAPKIEAYARQIHEAVRKRLSQFFPFQLSAEW